MENASKALIIAGAILISIILISIGIIVVQSAGEVTDRASTTMDEQAIQIFNQKFKNYEGDDRRGSSVRDLIGVVSSSNTQNPDDLVSVTYGKNAKKTASADLDKIRQSIKNSSRYDVKCTTGAQGQITGITITDS